MKRTILVLLAGLTAVLAALLPAAMSQTAGDPQSLVGD